MILGTAAYMAPEQARGKAVDRRADIWAFGAVLFEMLTGTRAFEGEDIADTLGNVMKVEPNWQKLPASMPPRVVQVLRACLQKNPKQRLDSAQGVRLALEGAFETAAPPATIPGPGATPAPARRLPWAVVVASLIAAGTLLMLWAPWRSAPTVSELRFQFPQRGSWFISPDGQRAATLLFGQYAIAIREMNDPEPRVLQLANPLDTSAIWSPDSRSIAYQSRDFKLMKSAIDGSPPVQLADLPALGGGSWSDDGVIIVGVRKGGLQRVPASGGTLTPVTTLAQGQSAHSLPQFIGGGRFLYAAQGDKATSGIYVASLTDPNGRLVLPGEFASTGQTFAYVPPVSGAGDGYILYTAQNVLLAQAVDPSSLALKGSAASIAQDAQWLSASLNGTLVYAPDTAGASARAEWRWLDRTGKEIPGVSGATGGGDAAISRSGTRWARSLQGDIWLHGMGGGAPSRFTFESTDDRFFTWSPDDQWIAYATGSSRAHDRILRLNTVTPSTAEALVSGGTDLQANDWSRDGKLLLFSDAGMSTGWDMWTLDLQAKDAKPVPYLQTPAGERYGAFSPDGRWIAYQSDESGQLEVYVQSFPPGAGKFQVSAGGGLGPRWRADGRELYIRSDGNLMAVTIQTSPRFEAGVPQRLFSDLAAPSGTVRGFDVSPDGSRFLVAMPSTSERDVPSVTVIVNWQAGLKAAGGQ